MIVIDASIFIAGIFDDEKSELANNIMDQIAVGEVEICIPSLFYLEISNTLLTSFRRKRIDEKKLNKYQKLVTDLSAEVDNNWDISKYTQIALKHSLTIYDSVYIELAVRKKYPLATLDKSLSKAAETTGILYWG